jgi:phosphoribosylformylglycinamidine synthase
MGAAVSLSTELRPELALFHEGPSRILVSTAAAESVETIARKHGIECVRLGATMKERLQIDHDSVTWIDCRVGRLRDVWENALENLLTLQHV